MPRFGVTTLPYLRPPHHPIMVSGVRSSGGFRFAICRAGTQSDHESGSDSEPYESDSTPEDEGDHGPNLEPHGSDSGPEDDGDHESDYDGHYISGESMVEEGEPSPEIEPQVSTSVVELARAQPRMTIDLKTLGLSFRSRRFLSKHLLARPMGCQCIRCFHK
ncbi:hypothetical protein ACLB2K_045879 [Fragaria x ananassa]